MLIAAVRRAVYIEIPNNRTGNPLPSVAGFPSIIKSLQALEGEVMDAASLYQRLLNPPSPWRVERVELSGDSGRVDVWIVHPAGFRPPCPECGAPCPAHDHTAEREWRHLDSCGATTWIHARLPRARCPEHGIRQCAAPLSGEMSHLTMAMERRCVDTLLECSRSGAARLTGLSWDEADGLMSRAVSRGLARRGDAVPSRLGIDEKAVFKRHQYCTVITDLAGGRVLDVLDSRRNEKVEPWFKDRRDKLAGVEAVAMDMNAGYAGVVSRLVPGAVVCFDHFHVTQMLGRAVDEVRKAEQRGITDPGKRQCFFRSRFLPLYNEENIPADRRGRFEEFRRVAVKTSRAWAIKENFRGLWKCASKKEAEDFFKKWRWWATHSRLEPIRRVAKCLKKHWQGILNAITMGVTNACTEGLNSKIEKIKRDAFGFRSKDRLRTAILFHCGGLDLYPETAPS